MGSGYRPIATAPEKAPRHSYESSTTLDGLDDGEALSKTSLSSPRSDSRSSKLIAASRILWLLQGTLFLTSLSMLVLSSRIRLSTLKHVQQFSAWSPAASAVEYSSVKYNITTTGNRFVGAGPEVDKAWREISYDMGDQWISESDIRKLGMPETSLKVDHPQTGEQGYRVGIEVFHQLHCINLLRRVTYSDYYQHSSGELAVGREKLQKHTDHCLEVLRLNTQCNADVGLFTLYMVEGDPQAWPELNSKHVCRDFDRVREWALDHTVGNMEILK